MFRFPRLILLLLLFHLAAKAESRTDCNVMNSHILRQAVHYCVQLPSDDDSNGIKQPKRRYPALYFLHGLGQNEQTLFSTGGWNLIEDLRRQHRISDFLIVAPEGRRSFYINSVDNSFRSGNRRAYSRKLESPTPFEHSATKIIVPSLLTAPRTLEATLTAW